MQFSGNANERGWGLFPHGWTGEVLQLVIDVWADFELPKTARLEPRITKLLTGAIIERYEEEHRDWFCVPEAPDWDDQGKEISRTDIRIYPPGLKRRNISFVFESKRLNTPASNASEYVGVGGMMCFVPNGGNPAKYASGLPCGAMLAYVMDGRIPRAHKAVCKAIKAKSTLLQLASSGEYQPSPLLKNNQWHGQTRHQFPKGYFTIYHLLLPVRWGEKATKQLITSIDD